MSQRSPILSMVDNLIWTTGGAVWAVWRLHGAPYGHIPVKDRREVRDLHTGLIRGLRGESLMLSVLVPADPVDVVHRMIDGLDLEEHPDWAVECEETLAELDELPATQRTFWLAVPLPWGGVAQQVRASMDAALGVVFDQLAWPQPLPSSAQRAARATQALDVERGIPGPFEATRARPAEVAWLFAQAGGLEGMLQDRYVLDHDAVAADIATGNAADTAAADTVARARPGDGDVGHVSGTSVPEVVLDEGGRTDLARGLSPAGMALHRRRYLKVITARAGEPDVEYQALLALRSVPAQGMLFPGSEFLGKLDESGVPVDWALRLNVRSAAAVAHANMRAVNNLNDQYSQRDAEVSLGTRDLDIAAGALRDLVSALAEDTLEVEVRATCVFRVRGASGADANTAAGHLARYLESGGFRVEQPIGLQQTLWWAMLPGTPTTRALRSWEQVTTSRSLAAAIPLAGHQLGDSRGSLLGLNISAGSDVASTGHVLWDPAAAVIAGSGSIGIVGELRAGKSMTMKKLAGDICDRGGLVVAIDRTEMGEWSVWAQSVTDASVIDMVHPTHSLDPLRLFGAAEGSRVLQSFLTPLLDIPPTSEQGILLSEILDVDYLAEHHISSAGALMEHLHRGCEMEGAKDLARKMRVFGRGDLGRAVFDPSLPPLRWRATVLVFRTNVLQLPTREEITHQHLFQQMRLEKTYGRAAYALIAAVSRRLLFEDRTRLAGLFCDEAHHLTSSPEGEAEMEVVVRDGAKHGALLCLGSHSAATDFGGPVLQGLIPNRLVMRHRDDRLAREALDWLGLDGQDDDLAALVKNGLSPIIGGSVPFHRRGEGLFRDGRGRIGTIKVLAPARGDRREAALTSPHITASRTPPPTEVPLALNDPTDLANLVTAEAATGAR